MLPKFFHKAYFNAGSSSLTFVAATMAANILNYAFNAYLGRKLSFIDLSLIGLITSLWYVFNIPLSALSTSVNYQVAHLDVSSDRATTASAFNAYRRQALYISLIASFVLIFFSFPLAHFFHTSVIAIASLAPAIFLASLASVNRGVLQGKLLLLSLGLIMVSEPLSKLLFGAYILHNDMPTYVYLAIPSSVAVSYVCSMFFMRDDIKLIQPKKMLNVFPKLFFWASLLTGISTLSFLSLDLLLAKHFLSSTEAGKYALLSTVGKLIFFLGSLLNPLLVTYVSRDLGKGHNPFRIFYLFAAAELLILFILLLIFKFEGPVILQLLFGQKALMISNYLFSYTLGIALFTFANLLATFYAAKKQFLPTAGSVISATILIILISSRHTTIHDLVMAVLYSGIFNITIISVFHFYDKLVPTKKMVAEEKNKDASLRILIFNWRDTKHVFAGGAEMYIHELAKQWVKEGNTVTLFCGSDRKTSPYEIVDGVEIIRKGGFYVVYFWAILYYFRQFRGKYDYIIDCHNGIPFFTPLYAKEPIICILHHVHQEVFRQWLPKPLAVIAQFLEVKAMPWAYKKICFVTVSNSSKEEMIAHKITSKKIAIVHPGVHLENFYAGDKDPVPTVTYLGRLKAYKQIDVLLRAFRHVLDKIPESRLFIAGVGEDQKRLQGIALELNILDSCTFLGRITESEKLSLLQQSWVTVNPSSMEGWGITSIESNACGTPVIASNVPGLRDSVVHGKTGYLVKSGDVEEFSQALKKILHNTESRLVMGNESIRWAQGFNWKASSIQFINLLYLNNHV